MEQFEMEDQSKTEQVLLQELASLRQRFSVLERSEKESRFLAESMADAAFKVDMNLKATYISPSIERLLGYSPAERMSQTINERLTPLSRKLVLEALAMGLERDKTAGADPDMSRVLELEYYHKNGSVRYFETHVLGIRDGNGNLTGFSGLSRDITDRKNAETKLKDTLDRLRKAIGTTIQVMVSAVETRDPYTAGHQVRSADLARAIATEMGFPHEKIDGIRIAGSIHDIGKLSIPTEILTKPSKLTEIEFSLIKEHSWNGYEILKNVESSWPLAEMVYQHHERMDGSGYPRNLKGDDILMEARIIAVADVVESMASHRPYRPALGINAAFEEIVKNRITLYDADVVDACLRLFKEKGFKLKHDMIWGENPRHYSEAKY
jgi:PAS domain S-box-containing protein